MISIALTRESVNYEGDNQHVWPLKITAVATGMDSEIFVYHVAVAGSAYAGDVCENVASIPELQETPKNVPVPGVPFYRMATALFACRSTDEAERTWLGVVEDVQELVAQMNAMNNLTEIEHDVIS